MRGLDWTPGHCACMGRPSRPSILAEGGLLTAHWGCVGILTCAPNPTKMKATLEEGGDRSARINPLQQKNPTSPRERDPRQRGQGPKSLPGEPYAGARRQGALAPQLPRATRSSEFPSEGFCTVLKFWGFHGTFRSSFPSSLVELDSAPFYPKKHVFRKNRRIVALKGASIRSRFEKTCF